MNGPTDRSSCTSAPRSNSVPWNSLQRRVNPQSLRQRGGHCCLPAPCNVRLTQGVSPMGFRSLRTAVLFGLVALALTANEEKPISAAQQAPPSASPSVALSASPASAQAGQPVTLAWSSTNATSVTLQPSVGPIAAQGSATVRPSQSTTYTSPPRVQVVRPMPAPKSLSYRHPLSLRCGSIRRNRSRRTNGR
jgi:hypothetical protein